MTMDPVISARELAARTDVVLVDCRPDPRAYAAGHVAGARHAQLERDLAAHVDDPAHGGRHPLPDPATFAATLGRWGITRGSHVVAYDDQGGANAAARLWWMLRAIGHDAVQIVDGGLAALRAAGFAMTTDEPTVDAAPPYPIGALRGVADIEEVERARGAADRRVIDVRAGFRFRGESDPFDPVAGHIPGARNAPYADNLRADGTFKTPDELRAQLTAALDGIAPAQTIVHCGSGVTACHTLVALARAGLPGAKLYIGSWSEWCRDPARAREPAG
jgi:thiosulfate/3-mercaptopyruvate sulfurtransferase